MRSALLFLLPVFLFPRIIYAAPQEATSKYTYGDEAAAVTSTTSDLDGDGTAEKISLTNITEAGAYILHVGKAAISGHLFQKPDGVSIVDINTADKYKEIDVWVHADSDYDDHFLYWYDGKMLRAIRGSMRWPSFPGGGMVLVGDSMGFWIKTEKYLLDKITHKLVFVPQEFYAANLNAKVTKSFPIYVTRNAATVVANLKPDSTATILICGRAPGAKSTTEGATPTEWDWYLLKTASGLTGWVKLSTFKEKMVLTWFD